MLRFNFGINWQEYSNKALNTHRFRRAVDDLEGLVGKRTLVGKSFLDIGCGSGVHALAAVKSGAEKVVGVDISRESIEASNTNKKRFLPKGPVEFIQVSVFEMDLSEFGTFDIVYSWGVLHHTGDMKKAINRASKFVSRDGLLILALYNRHWSSPFWWLIKRFYNQSPKWLQHGMVVIFSWIIALAKLLVTGKNPYKKKRRGMTFHYDVIDWLGGFPYEYASKKEVIEIVKPLGFEIMNFTPAEVPTGCHEYVLAKSLKSNS